MRQFNLDVYWPQLSDEFVDNEFCWLLRDRILLPLDEEFYLLEHTISLQLEEELT